MPLGDLAPGASQEITWFYAAGAIADIESIIGEVAQAAGSVINIGPSSADLEVTSSEDGVGHWMVVPQGSMAPTPEQIEAGANYGDVSVVASNEVALVQDVATTIELAPLSQGTAYTAYFVVANLDGDGQTVYSDTIVESFTTTLPVPDPVQSLVVASASNPSVGEAVTITVTALDSTGNPVVGLAVNLAATPATDVTIEAPNPATTLDDGRITFVVNSAVPQSVRFTASHNPDIGFVDVEWSEAAPPPEAAPSTEAQAIPIVDVYGLLAMSGLLGLIGAMRIRSRRAS